MLVQAGASAAPRAPATAAAWYSAALRLLPEATGTAGQRLGLLVVLAQCHAATGELTSALEALAAALDLAGGDDALASLRARLVAGCAMCETCSVATRPPTAGSSLRSRTSPTHGRSSRADLQVELAADALYDGDFTAMQTWAQLGLDAAIALGEPALTVVAQSLICFAELGLGGIAAAAAVAAAAAGLDALSDDAIALRLDAPYYLGFAEFFAERYEDATRHLRRGIAVSRASGQGQFATPMAIGLAHAYEVTGRPRAGLDQAEAAVEAARLSSNSQVLCWALTAEAWISAIAGELHALAPLAPRPWSCSATWMRACFRGRRACTWPRPSWRLASLSGAWRRWRTPAGPSSCTSGPAGARGCTRSWLVPS